MTLHLTSYFIHVQFVYLEFLLDRIKFNWKNHEICSRYSCYILQVFHNIQILYE